MLDRKALVGTSGVGHDASVKLEAPAGTRTEPADAGSVGLRGQTVALKSDIGEAFVTDCVRNVEGALSDAEVKHKWGLSDENWADLSGNAPLLAVVRAEHDRRVLSGECGREKALRHFAMAPDVLNRLLTDDQVAPRHRIEAARELRQTAGSGPEIASGPQEKFKIIINLGADETFVKEVHYRPALLTNDNDGEPS